MFLLVSLHHSLLPVLSGVPQRSILGPLFFIIFVNDLPSSLLFSSIFLFADDAKSIMPVSSISDCHLLQSDLARIVKWSATWKLLLNEDKCSITHFTSNQFPLTYYYSINGKFLPSKPTQRDIGVTVLSDYQWKYHFQTITSPVISLPNLPLPSNSDILYLKTTPSVTPTSTEFQDYGTPSLLWILLSLFQP